MPVEVILPRVDMDMASGRISRWLVDDGAAVTKGAPIFEIETDKAAMEIDAPADGIFRHRAALDADLPVGTTVALILADGEALPSAPDAHSTPIEHAPSSSPAIEPKVEADPVTPTVDADPGPAGLRATPLARRLARLEGIDLSAVVGTGPKGRIQAEDVRRRRTGAAPSVAAPSVAASVAASPPLADDVDALARPRAAEFAGGLHRVRLREGTGRSVVLIHGFGAEIDGWRPLLQGLSPGRGIDAVDLPGHGRSPALAQPSFDGLVEALAGTLQDLGPAGIDLVGHSLGAALCAALADTGLPVRSLFLISPAGLGPDIHGGFVEGFARARSEASLAPWMRLLVEDEAALPRAFVRATAASRADGTLPDAQARLAASLFPDGTQAFDVHAALSRFAGPASVVFGTADRIIPARHADRLPGTVALHRFAGVGHLPHLERRAEVALLLERHLRAAG